jgi:hypothetical protein
MIGVLICTKLPDLIEREAITPEIGAVTLAVGEFEVRGLVGREGVLEVIAQQVDVVGAHQLLVASCLERA